MTGGNGMSENVDGAMEDTHARLEAGPFERADFPATRWTQVRFRRER
jgi:hypothetical protein